MSDRSKVKTYSRKKSSYLKKAFVASNFNEMCRLCLSEMELGLTPIIQDSDKVSYREWIEYGVDISVEEGDGLPPNICKNCLTLAEQTYLFKKKCKASDSKLREHLKLVELDDEMRQNALGFNNLEDEENLFRRNNRTLTSDNQPEPYEGEVEAQATHLGTNDEGAMGNHITHDDGNIFGTSNGVGSCIFGDVFMTPLENGRSDVFHLSNGKPSDDLEHQTVSFPKLLNDISSFETQLKEFEDYFSSNDVFIPTEEMNPNNDNNHKEDLSSFEVASAEVYDAALKLLDNSNSDCTDQDECPCPDSMADVLDTILCEIFDHCQYDTSQQVEEDEDTGGSMNAMMDDGKIEGPNAGMTAEVNLEANECVDVGMTQNMSARTTAEINGNANGDTNVGLKVEIIPSSNEKFDERMNEVVKVGPNEDMSVGMNADINECAGAGLFSGLHEDVVGEIEVETSFDEEVVIPGTIGYMNESMDACVSVESNGGASVPLTAEPTGGDGAGSITEGGDKGKPSNVPYQINRIYRTRNFIEIVEMVPSVTMYSCYACTDHFRTLPELHHHMSTEHGITESASCEICYKTFRSENNLRRHMLLHAKDKRYKCPTCNKAFGTVSALKRHNYTHEHVKPFVCGVCNKGYTQKLNLDLHLRTHFYDGEEIGYGCPTCHKSYVYQSGLSRHMKEHKGYRFMCSVCGVSFNDATVLQRHVMNSHDGIN